MYFMCLNTHNSVQNIRYQIMYVIYRVMYGIKILTEFIVHNTEDVIIGWLYLKFFCFEMPMHVSKLKKHVFKGLILKI